MPKLPVLVLLACQLLPAQAVTLRMCTDESMHTPLMTPDGRGIADLLIRAAAAEHGLQVEYHPAPVTRCREEVRLGRADAFPMVPRTASLDGMVALPRSGGAVDTTRAVATLRSMVYRRVGSAVAWDGRQFSGLRTRVLVPAGSMLLLDRLKELNIAVDDSGKGFAANLSKLAAGRADVAVGVEVSGMQLIAGPPFAGQVEALPVPFLEEPYFLGVSQQFYIAHPQLMERVWDSLARIRRTPAFQQQWRRTIGTPLLTQ